MNNSETYFEATPEEQKLFWSKVDRNNPTQTGCWLWTAALRPNGYGVLNFRGKTIKASRLAWMITNKRILGKDGTFHGECVLHKCDVRKCCNPEHLFTGSQKDNMEDMCKKGRYPANRNLPVGNEHWSRKNPELIARGDRSGARLHPETIPFGENHRMAKLTEKDVLSIRKLITNGCLRKAEIARLFNVTPTLIGHINKRKIWKHI